MRVYCEPVWPWPVVILLAAATLLLVVWTYRRQGRGLPSGFRQILLTLRLLAWGILLFVWLRPVLEFTEPDRQAAVFAILTDRSRSMSVADGPAGSTRRQALLQTLQEAEPQLNALAREVDLRQYEFDAQVETVEARVPATPGGLTSIGNCLDDLLRLFESRRIAGVLLLSDGAQRAQAPRNLEARAAASRYAELQIPIHTVGYGASALSDQAVDLAVEDLRVNPTVFLKNTVVVSARVRAAGAAGKDVQVRVLLEDRSRGGPGEKPQFRLAAPVRALHPRQNQELATVEFSFTAETPGEQMIVLEAVPLPGEPQVLNNRVATYFNVLKGGISVAYFDKIRPEQKWIRSANESPEIKLDYKPIRRPLGGEWPRLETTWFASGKYDVYVIGDVPAEAFSQEQLAALGRLLDRGAGLMMLGGFHSFGPGGYARTPLADYLPVTVLATEAAAGGEIDPTLHINQPLQMVPTPGGLREFIMRLDQPAQNMARWQALAPLEGANRFSGLKPLARVLAQSREGEIPLLVAQDVGRSRVLAFAADTTYQWVQAGQREEHQRFWQQAILWLAHKDQAGDESLWIQPDNRRVQAGQPVQILYGARDSVKRPLTDVDFTLEVTGPEGFREQVAVPGGNPENLQRFINTQKPGEYRATVTGRRKNVPFGSPASARFIVYEYDLELNHPAADPALLADVSRSTLGTALSPEQLPKFLQELVRSGKLRVELEKLSTQSLWDNGIVVAVFVALLTAEWWLRKRRGLV